MLRFTYEKGSCKDLYVVNYVIQNFQSWGGIAIDCDIFGKE